MCDAGAAVLVEIVSLQMAAAVVAVARMLKKMSQLRPETVIRMSSAPVGLLRRMALIPTGSTYQRFWQKVA